MGFGKFIDKEYKKIETKVREVRDNPDLIKDGVKKLVSHIEKGANKLTDHIEKGANKLHGHLKTFINKLDGKKKETSSEPEALNEDIDLYKVTLEELQETKVKITLIAEQEKIDSSELIVDIELLISKLENCVNNAEPQQDCLAYSNEAKEINLEISNYVGQDSEF